MTRPRELKTISLAVEVHARSTNRHGINRSPNPMTPPSRFPRIAAPRPRGARFIVALTLLAALSLLPFTACTHAADKELILYTSVDQPFAAPIARAFEQKTGLHVLLVTDTEATKSVGLAERLRAEKDHPQADVFWSNEVFHTINLAHENVLAPYDSPARKDIPKLYKDPDARWTATALRARVIALSLRAGDAVAGVNTLEDLTRPEFKGRIAMALPTAGTTGGQVAALYVLWGQSKADAWFHALHDNGVKLLGGNSVVAQEVGQGLIWIGLTDNDDVAEAKSNDGAIKMVLPNQHDLGTLTMPTSVGLVAGAPHPDAARKLIDYLLSPEVEKHLIDKKFARYSVRDPDKPIKAMQVDYAKVAAALPQSVRRATAILQGR
jgi:iron(III) transport system substrate-binding protein